MIKEFINRIKAFISSNPQRVKLIGLLLVAAVVPLTVAVALTVQNLTQKASESPGVQIVNSDGDTLSVTSEVNVLLKVNLPSGWIAPLPSPSPSAMNNNVNIVKNAYAAASCTVTLKWDPMQFAGRKRQILFGGGPTVLSSNLDPIVTYDILPLDGNAIGSAGTYTFRNNVVAGTYTFDVNDYPEGSVHSVEVTAVADCSSNTQIQTPKRGLGKPCDNGGQCASSKCGNYDEFGTGECVASGATSIETLTSTPAPTLAPQTPKLGLGKSCGNNTQCASSKCGNLDESGNGMCVASGATSIETLTSTPAPTLAPQTPKTNSTPTPAPQIVEYILVENKDADGSGGGYDPLQIASNIENAIRGVPWRLNELSFAQTQATRTVQVTFFGDRGGSIAYAASVTLVPRGTSTDVVITPAPKVSPTTSTLTPEIKLTLTCQSKSKVQWNIITNGITTPMNLDVFIGGNNKFSLKGKGGNFAVSNFDTSTSGDYSEAYNVSLRDSNTNQLLASANKQIDCSVFNPIISTPTPTPVSISSAPVMKFDLSCQDKSTVKYTLSTTGAKPGMVLDLWIDGNKVPQPGWAANSSVSGKGANGNYASTLTDPVTYKVLATGGAPTKDCELFAFAFDLNHDGKVDTDDVKIVQSQSGTKGVNLDADLNKDGKIDEIDYNIILKHVKNNL